MNDGRRLGRSNKRDAGFCDVVGRPAVGHAQQKAGAEVRGRVLLGSDSKPDIHRYGVSEKITELTPTGRDPRGLSPLRLSPPLPRPAPAVAERLEQLLAEPV